MKKNYFNSPITNLCFPIVLFLLTQFNSFAQDGSYCIPSNNGNTDYYITGITSSGGLTNFSTTGTGLNGGYSDYTASHEVSIYPGESFSLTATNAADAYLYGAWVDWNRDFEFSDDESALHTGLLDSPALLGNVIAPANVEAGAYRLRVRCAFRGLPMPCGEHVWGEAEDYTINIINVTACFPPYGLTVTPSPDFTKADLIWSHPVTGPTPRGYEYVFSTVATAPVGSGTLVTENYVYEANFSTGISYYLFVRSLCDETDSSPWENISFLDSATYKLTDSRVTVYKEGGVINVTSNSALITGVTIYDTSGRTLYTQTANNITQTAITGLQLQQQVVLVEINTLKGKVIKRIVF